MGGWRGEGAGFEARLRLISVIFFAVAVVVLAVTVNTPLRFDENVGAAGRASLNVISALAAVFGLGVLAFPWRRFGRNAFAVVPVMATVFIALVIAFSGGFDSFGYRFFVLVAVFYGLYFPLYVILLGMLGVVAAGASPMLYGPDLSELLEFLVVSVPVHLTVALTCSYVVRRAELQEQARVTSEARLRRERERGERLRREAEVDGLTGISNRRHLEERLGEEIARSERFGEGFALLFADLDDFKAVNDMHGHMLGDEALRLVARSLSENARQIDVVSRYGGEEFVVLLPGTTTEGAATFYGRVREDLLERSQEELGFSLRVSAGAVGSGSGKTAEGLLAAADEAMYEAKRRGKDGIFVPEM